MLSADLINLELLFEEYVERQQRPVINVAAPDLTDIVQAVQGLKGPASAEEIAEALARRLAPVQAAQAELPAVMNDIRDSLKKMNDRLIGVASRSYSGGANIPDQIDRKLGMVTTSDQATIATESTLNAILDATANVEDALHAEVEGIASGAWATVVTYTPSVATTVLGFNADVSALTDIIYRMRLTVGGVVKCSETIGASANSWIPLKTDVAAGTTITVDVFHGETLPQTFRASLSYGS